MKKLTNNSNEGEFLTRAHIVICAQPPKFTLEQVYADMKATCDETVTLDKIKKYVSILMERFLDDCWISKVGEDVYINHITEKESTI